MAVGDIFQLKLTSSMDSQSCLNVFYYYSTGTGDGTAEDLSVTFATSVVPSIAAIMSGYAGLSSIETIQVGDLGDFYSMALADGGTISGDPYPVFVASCFKYLRTTRAVRNGAKRFVGVPESASSDGLNMAPAYGALVATLETKLKGDVIGDLDTYTPGIFHKTSGPHAPLAGTIHAISDVTWSHFGTQNTRKIGRGM